jgi:hypothetical protein
MTRITRAFVATVAVFAASAAWAQAPKADDATISKQQATRTALAAVPGGRVKSAELEHEGGKHVWSFDITRPGVPGATEIQVDAKTGEIVANKHESPAEEAKEARAEAKEANAGKNAAPGAKR